MMNLSFKGTYKIDTSNNSYEKIEKVGDYFNNLYEKGVDCIKYASYPKKLGDITRLTYVVPDNIDYETGSYLKTLGVNFKKYSDKDLFNEESIKARMVVPKHLADQGWVLAAVKTKEFNNIYMQEVNYGYVGDKEEVEHPDRCREFGKYLKTGLDIEASEVYIKEEYDRLRICFNDGRHRYAFMRDILEFERIPVALSPESYLLAKKYNLI